MLADSLGIPWFVRRGAIMQDVLKKLEIESVNAGGFCGEWIGSGEKLDSVSPIDGKAIASVTHHVMPRSPDGSLT